jgi:hypothetical protein
LITLAQVKHGPGVNEIVAHIEAAYMKRN